MKKLFTVLIPLLLLGMMAPQVAVSQQAQVVNNKRMNRSAPLRDYRPPQAAPMARAPYAVANKISKFGGRNDNATDKVGFTDPVRQMAQGPLAPTIFQSFEGSNDDDNAAILGFRIVPPDTDGDVGPNHYVQWINSISEIFDKNGNTLVGPFAGNAYFAGLGGDCETDNDGDPIVLYDEQADRWLVSQFSVDASPYSMCVAISQTPDPTGAYNQYEFDFGSDFPDYPKLGIWGDSYTMTTRDFANGQFFAGISAVAMDRSAMLAGNATTMVRFPNAFGGTGPDGYLPADSDSPVSGPAIFGGHGDDGNSTFELWELDVDWNNPGAATFTSISGVSVSAYDGVVPSANQPNGQSLDDLSNFTMHRMNVRDFGSHLSMVANHTVETTTGTAGIRWYEFRNTGGNWTLYQEGTYSPDTADRWMGSIAINAAGEISLGYSHSSSTDFPSIRFTGQTTAASGTGTMDILETVIIQGNGAQEGASRWGDYAMMSVDPVDDRFWFTTEYYAATGSFDFNTRIASYELGLPAQATDVHVDNITTGTQNVGGGNRQGTATVTIRNDLGQPVAGYDVTGTFSGDINESTGTQTTDASGNVSFTTSGTAKGNISVSFCVNTVSGALPYDSNDNADPAYDCGGGTGNATDVHVENISTGTQGVGGGNKVGTASVTILDDTGAPAVGYDVTGTFSGDISESAGPATTNGSGVASFTTVGTARGGVSVSFCVDTVSGALPYDPNDNASTSYDCSTAAPITSGAKSDQDVLKLAAGEVPEDYALGQNYPNPFNPTTILSYALPEAGHVTLKVYNLLGQEISTLVDGTMAAGVHNVAFNAENLSAGVYLYVMQSGDYTATRRMTLLK